VSNDLVVAGKVKSILKNKTIWMSLAQVLAVSGVFFSYISDASEHSKWSGPLIYVLMGSILIIFALQIYFHLKKSPSE